MSAEPGAEPFHAGSRGPAGLHTPGPGAVSAAGPFRSFPFPSLPSLPSQPSLSLPAPPGGPREPAEWRLRAAGPPRRGMGAGPCGTPAARSAASGAPPLPPSPSLPPSVPAHLTRPRRFPPQLPAQQYPAGGGPAAPLITAEAVPAPPPRLEAGPRRAGPGRAAPHRPPGHGQRPRGRAGALRGGSG